MHPELFGRLYNQMMLNQAYMKTILANQCIILANQTEKKADHKALFNKFHKEVYNQYRQLIEDDKKVVIKKNQSRSK